MAFLDGLLGLNRNDASNEATLAANAGLSATAQGNAQTLWNTATSAGDLASRGAMEGQDALLAWLNGQGRADITNNNAAARGALTSGMGTAANTVQGSNAMYQPYLQGGTAANGLYQDALGLNGATGNQRAQDAFQTSPGYQWNVDQSSDAAMRKMSAMGMLGSGNTADAITRLASNLGNQEYGSWLDRLNGLSGQGMTAANAISGNNQAAAGYQAGSATGEASLWDKLSSALGGLDTTLGTTQANLRSSLGNSLSNIQTNMGQQMVANNWQGTGQITQNLINNAKQQDSANNANNGIFSGLVGGLAKLALA